MPVKMTINLDEETAAGLKRMAARFAKPKSEVVRDALREHEARSGRLTEEERIRQLRVLDRIMKQPPTRPQAEVDRELRELRASRRRGWSRPSDPQ